MIESILFLYNILYYELNEAIMYARVLSGSGVNYRRRDYIWQISVKSMRNKLELFSGAIFVKRLLETVWQAKTLLITDRGWR